MAAGERGPGPAAGGPEGHAIAAAELGRLTAGERFAALTALVALGAAVVIVLAGVAASWVGVTVTVTGLLGAVVAGWYAVSRHGSRRIVAAVVAAVGAGLVVQGFVVADPAWSVWLAVTVLAGLSVGATRVALRRSARALRRLQQSSVNAPPARHPVLIINPKSGGGKSERHHLVEECRRRGIEPIVLKAGDDLLALAHAAIAGGADVIGMAGGDGSQALVATAASRHDVPLVVVPAGTRNHLALDLGLDRADVVGALDAYGESVERRIDLADVNGRVFVNNATVGIYAKVVQSPRYRAAKRRTVTEMLPELVGPEAVPADLRFTEPDGTPHPTADVILVSNDPYQLHHLAGKGTRERIDQGVLGIVATRIPNAAAAGALVALEMTRRTDRFEGWLEWTAPRFRIDSGAPVEIALDGEALKLEPPLLFESRPGALRVRLPRHAPGRSPTARAAHVLSRSTVTQLVRVAAGRQGQEVPAPYDGTR